jgi:hypothetical protein
MSYTCYSCLSGTPTCPRPCGRIYCELGSRGWKGSSPAWACPATTWSRARAHVTPLSGCPTTDSCVSSARHEALSGRLELHCKTIYTPFCVQIKRFCVNSFLLYSPSASIGFKNQGKQHHIFLKRSPPYCTLSSSIHHNLECILIEFAFVKSPS